MTPPPDSPQPSSESSGIPLHLYGIMPKQKKGLAVAGLVLGVLAVVSFFLVWLSVLLAIVGLVLSVKALKRKTARDIAVMGLVASILGLVLVAAFVAITTFGWNNKMAWDAAGSCSYRVSSIGRGIAIYQAAHADQYPPNLEALLGDGVFLYDHESLRCPLDDLSDGTSYFYCAPRNNPTPQDGTLPASFIIACEAVPAHPVTGFFGPDESNNRRHVLWSDGRIRLCTEAEFQQELQKTENRRFAKELAKGTNMTPRERIKYTAPRDEE